MKFWRSFPLLRKRAVAYFITQGEVMYDLWALCVDVVTWPLCGSMTKTTVCLKTIYCSCRTKAGTCQEHPGEGQRGLGGFQMASTRSRGGLEKGYSVIHTLPSSFFDRNKPSSVVSHFSGVLHIRCLVSGWKVHLNRTRQRKALMNLTHALFIS